MDKKISQLDSISSINNDAVFPFSQEVNGEDKTVKSGVEQIGDYIAKEQNHPTLNTISKKLIGAINEILSSIGTIEGTASGSVASFNDGGDNIPVKSLVAEIVASQAGSGTPSPDNPRAISGYTDVVIKNDVQGTTQATYTIALGSTVYMGTLNVTTGILTVTHAYQVYDGTENWQYSENGSGRQRVYLPIAGAMPDSINIIGNIIEKAAAPTAGYPADWTASFNHNASPSLLIGVPSTITSAQDFKDLISNTNLQVVYELASPVTVSLSVPEVVTLLGENNIYANSGDVEVEYFNEDASQFNDLIETIITSSSSDYHVYSTNEKVVGRWIDGKPIYEKTFVFSSSITIGKVWTATGFTITNGSFITNSILMRFNNNGTIAHSVNILPSTGAITLSTDSDYTNLTAGSTLTVQYIKTTD